MPPMLFIHNCDTMTDVKELHAKAIKLNKKIDKLSAGVNQKPVLTVKTYKSNVYAYAVDIPGPSRVVYSPDKPLSCGAKVWIETQAEVVIKEQNVQA